MSLKVLVKYLHNLDMKGARTAVFARTHHKIYALQRIKEAQVNNLLRKRGQRVLMRHCINKLKDNVRYSRELIYNERKAIQFYTSMFTAYNNALHSNKIRYRGCYDLR